MNPRWLIGLALASCGDMALYGQDPVEPIQIEGRYKVVASLVDDDCALLDKGFTEEWYITQTSGAPEWALLLLSSYTRVGYFLLSKAPTEFVYDGYSMGWCLDHSKQTWSQTFNGEGLAGSIRLELTSYCDDDKPLVCVVELGTLGVRLD